MILTLAGKLKMKNTYAEHNIISFAGPFKKRQIIPGMPEG